MQARPCRLGPAIKLAESMAESKTEPLAIKDYLRALMTEAGLINKIDYFLSGHIHNQQLVLSEKNQLQQIIVGHSGTALDTFGQKIKNSKMISTTESKTSFGYAIFERTGFKN